MPDPIISSPMFGQQPFQQPSAPEQLGGPLNSLVTNSSNSVQVLGQILEALQNRDTVAASQGITSSSPTAGIGYADGAGGIVTQATSKSTGVTLNKICGQITMNNAALASGASVTFTVTNSTCTALTMAVVNHVSAGTAGSYRVQGGNYAAGSFGITVTNISGGSLSEAIVLGFMLMRYTTA